MKQKLLLTIALLCMVAQGAWAETVDLSTITKSYVAQDGDVLTGTFNTNILTRLNPVKISIADGASITLRDATILGIDEFIDNENGADVHFYEYAGITCLGDATITLEGTNCVRGFAKGYPGIRVPKNKTLVIQGDGSLYVDCNGDASAIGDGNCVSRSGNITIKSGTIVATGVGGPGIGAREEDNSCGIITIQGGNIRATGGNSAAGIGGDYLHSGGIIIIEGGTIEARGGEDGAGIGGGNGGHGGSITINGGTIKAYGGSEAAGIGGGEDGSGGDIRIYGGTIEAYGGEYAAGIGGGDGAWGGAIWITGGDITAYGGTDAAGIGGGESGDSGSIVINGGDVYAKGKGYGVGIGAGEDGDVNNTISINGGTVEAEGGLDIGRAIGGEDSEDYTPISIGQGMSITDVSKEELLPYHLRGYFLSSYIRLKFEPCDHAGATYSIVNAEKHQCICQWCGNFEEDHTAQTPCTKCGYTGKTLDLSTVQSNLTVLDGVTVTGTLNTASHPVKITIADGATVTLSGMNISGVNNSSYKWAGITCEGNATIILADGTTNTVKGFYEDYPGIYVPQNYSLTIKGETAGTGSLNASSNGFGAGIGGGYCGASCGVISINGGNITATGGKYCAGIGSSHNNSCSHILIYGGTINATGGENAAGIGSGWGGTNAGDFSSCGMINILSDVTSVTATKGAGAPNSIGAGYQGTCSVVSIGSKVGAVERSPYFYFPLANASSNSTKISAFNGEVCDVTLKGRTLYKDNSWNTLCLPFSISDFSGTPLAGATVKTLESTSFDSTNGALALNFTEANLTAIEAGKPYIVKWASGDNIENPMFTNVTITATTPTDITPTGSGSDGSVTFKGTFGPHDIGGTDGDNTKLYLGNGNKLYWPSGAKSINAFRAYFQLNNGITAGNQPNSGVRAFVLNFDGDEETGIATTNYMDSTDSDNAWYDLSGRKLSGKPTTKGLYINKGKMIVIK